MTLGLFVLLAVFPVVAAVESHVTVQSGDVLELPGTDAALHHVLNRLRLRLGHRADAGGLDQRVGGLDGNGTSRTSNTSRTSSSLALLALSDELFQQLELSRVCGDLGNLVTVQRVQSSKY